MREFRFNLKKRLFMKGEKREIALPIEIEVNEEELVAVTGGVCGHGPHGERCYPGPEPAPPDIGSYAGSLIRNIAWVR